MVPFDAVTAFFDPAVQFGLQFETEEVRRRRTMRGAERQGRTAPARAGQARRPCRLPRLSRIGRHRRRRRSGAARPLPKEVKTRTETDSFGPIEVAADRYWGAQTERSRKNFRIGEERMPRPLIRALAIVKRAAAETNLALGSLDARRAKAIVAGGAGDRRRQARRSFPAVGLADRLRHPDQHERQRGDRQPRQRNARRQARREIAGPSQRSRQHGPVVERQLPDRHAHRGGGGNIAAAAAGAGASAAALKAKTKEFASIVKIGRTHIQDATPLTLGQEFSGYAAQVTSGIARVKAGLKELYPLAQGGTAVGTGLNAKRGFAKAFAKRVAAITGLPFVSAPNKFEALASHGALVVRPRRAQRARRRPVQDRQRHPLARLRPALRLRRTDPAGERARLLDHARQGQSDPVRSPDHGVPPGVRQRHHGRRGGSQGHFELNVFKPVIAYAVLQSIRLLADAAVSFTDHCVAGIRANEPRIRELMQNSLMLVTALAPHIGYDKAAQDRQGGAAQRHDAARGSGPARLCHGRGVRPPGAARHR